LSDVGDEKPQCGEMTVVEARQAVGNFFRMQRVRPLHGCRQRVFILLWNNFLASSSKAAAEAENGSANLDHPAVASTSGRDSHRSAWSDATSGALAVEAASATEVRGTTLMHRGMSHRIRSSATPASRAIKRPVRSLLGEIARSRRRIILLDGIIAGPITDQEGLFLRNATDGSGR